VQADYRRYSGSLPYEAERLTGGLCLPNLKPMEINLTNEQEAQLSHFAALEGKGADELAREVFVRGLQAEAILIAARSHRTEGQEAAARLLELRRDNLLPEGVSIQDLIRDGRA
jgi:hypothetical protein